MAQASSKIKSCHAAFVFADPNEPLSANWPALASVQQGLATG